MACARRGEASQRRWGMGDIGVFYKPTWKCLKTSALRTLAREGKGHCLRVGLLG